MKIGENYEQLTFKEGEPECTLLFMCLLCGCVVHNTYTHDKWHNNYGKVAQAAYNADAFNRPIRVVPL